jgi:ribonuclease HI
VAAAPCIDYVHSPKIANADIGSQTFQGMKSMHLAEALHVFTDGSFNPVSGKGAWALVVFEGDKQRHAERGTGEGLSNNAFEVLGVLNAFFWLETSAPKHAATVWTDSHHVVEGIEHWRKIWRGNGWKRVNPNPRARRREIPDAVHWRALDALLDRNPHVTVRWCKAHAGNAGNEHADRLAAGKVPVERPE